MNSNAWRRDEVEWIVASDRNVLEKLGMDLAITFRLRAPMSDEAESEHRSDQITRTFGLLTAKLEDAATFAVDGQALQADGQWRGLALRIAGLAGEVATIAGALGTLLDASAEGPTSS